MRRQGYEVLSPRATVPLHSELKGEQVKRAAIRIFHPPAEVPLKVSLPRPSIAQSSQVLESRVLAPITEGSVGEELHGVDREYLPACLVSVEHLD